MSEFKRRFSMNDAISVVVIEAFVTYLKQYKLFMVAFLVIIVLVQVLVLER